MNISLKRQSGLALITVLLVFAVVSLLATEIINQEAYSRQRSQNLFVMQEARQRAYGLEYAVRGILYADWDKNKDIDVGGRSNKDADDWAKYRPLDQEAEGSPWRMSIVAVDAQGRFNLNSLHPSSANKAEQTKRLQRLLNILSLDTQLAPKIAAWMDKDSQIDSVYESMEPPYRAAYQGCKHPSEMLLIEEFDQKTFDKIEPFISCLPITAQLNINTASAEVLASLGDGLTLQDGKTLISNRGTKGFASVDEFWKDSTIERFTTPQNNSNNPNSNQTTWVKGDFDIKSEYFEAFLTVKFVEPPEKKPTSKLAKVLGAGHGEVLYQMNTEVMIKRDNSDGRMHVLYRDYSRDSEKKDPLT